MQRKTQHRRGHWKVCPINSTRTSKEEVGKSRSKSFPYNYKSKSNALKKTFKKLDHDVNIQDFLGMSNQTAEDLTNQASLLQTQLSEVHRRLSYWNGPEKINSVETLEQMENSVRESLNHIGVQKENFEKQQRLSLECTNQIQNGAQLSFGMGIEQQLQTLSWFPTDDSKNLLLPEDQNLLPHRDVECTASSSFGSYSGYFGTAKSSEISNSGQESAILNELTGDASLRLQVNGQFPFPPYSVNFLSDTKFQPLTDMSVQENPVDYHVNGIVETPRSGYDTTQATWASASGPFSVSMFDDQLFSRNPN